jgi:hypothetical protein
MCPSAISTPTFKALAGSIFNNYNGTTPVYSAGAWNFLNSSGSSTFSVSDAGAVTVGSSSIPNALNVVCDHTGGGMVITSPVAFGCTLGSAYSSGYTVLASNAYSTATNSDSWAGRYNTSAASTCLVLCPGTSGDAFQFRRKAAASATPAGFTTYFDTVLASCTTAGAWTFPVSVSVTGTADVSGTSAALRTDGGCYVAKIMSAGTVTDRTPFPEDLQTAIDAVNSMEKLPEGEYDSENKEKQLDHSKLHPYISSGDYRDMSATVSCLALVCQNLLARLASAEARIRLLEDK